MPVFRSGETPPPWCEMTFFEIVEAPPGEHHHFPRRGEKEKLIVCRGACLVTAAGVELAAEPGGNFNLPPESGDFTLTAGGEPVTIVRMCGRWGDETGGSGIFAVSESANPADRGDPVPYAKTTNFDSHFHDCDEYWIVWEGSGVAVSEGRTYEIGVGDCLATGMGHHHDLPRVHQPARGVYFETTLEGRKRLGHLWEHTHGPAEPHPERV
jgi:mannose-6-phosphate isomerase-like protein (cupin superfamily)